MFGNKSESYRKVHLTLYFNSTQNIKPTFLGDKLLSVCFKAIYRS